jgi:ParB family chromosome partitioning protein
MKKAKKNFEMHDDYAPAVKAPAYPTLEESELLKNEGYPGFYGIIEAPEQPDEVDIARQMDQVVMGLSGVRTAGQVYLIDVRQLEAYPEQPFHQYSFEQLQEMAEDISRVGILSPILVRRVKMKLQILAGHNRWAAAKLAGITHVPIMILEADDDQAALILTSTNLRQRERLLPSEKAFAYKMQMDALKRQGQRSAGGYSASSFITQQTGDSRMQIHRYTRLTELEPGLLELLDKNKIRMTAAVAASYLQPEDQREVLRCVRENGAKLTVEKAGELRRLVEEAGGKALGSAVGGGVLAGGVAEKGEPQWVKIRWDRIKEFVPEGVDVEEWVVENIRSK